MSGLTIESSLRVENRLGLCDWPCCSKRKPWVNRDNLALVRLTGLEEILDTVDQICSETSLTPLVWLLVIIIGVAATIPMVVYDYNMNFLWMPWVFPNICFLQPLTQTYVYLRGKRLCKAMEAWNRDVGQSQGVCLKVGINDKITAFWRFSHALYNCNCCGRTANIHICRINPTLNV